MARRKNTPDYELMTVEELRQEAAKQDIPGRSNMNKEELLYALQHGEAPTPTDPGSAPPDQGTPGSDPLPENRTDEENKIEPNPALKEGMTFEQSVADNKEYQEAMAEHNKHPAPAPARDPLTGDVIGITPGDNPPRRDARIVTHKHEPKLHKVEGFIRVGGTGNAAAQIINLAHIVSFTLPHKNDKSNSITILLDNGGKMTVTGDEAHDLMAALGPCCEQEMNLKNAEDIEKMRIERSKNKAK